MTLLCAVVSSAWGQETITFSENGYTNGETISTVEGSNFTITFNKGTSSNAPKYYTTGSAIRVYGGNTFIVSSTTKTIEKIELTFSSGEGSNEITTDDGDYQNGSWTGSSEEITFTIGGTSGHRRISAITVTFNEGSSSTVPAPTFDPPAGLFFEKNFGVSIKCEDESATIYYTTDGSTPNENSDIFSGNVITVRENITIKAIAIDSDGNKSSVATAVYTIIDQEPLANLGELTKLTKDEEGNYYVELSDAVVTYTNGNYAYIEDETGAIVLYKSGHGLKTGQSITGIAKVAFQLRNKNPQITNIDLFNYEIGETVPEPYEIAAESWEADFNYTLNQYYKVTGAKITQSNNKYYITLGGESVQLYGQGSASTIQVGDLRDTYTIVGFPTLYNSTKELQIFVQPVAEGTVEPLKDPALAFEEDRVIAYLSDEAVMPALSNDYGVEVTYTSSNTDVATIDSEGSITLVGTGSTVITASYEEDDEYYASSATFTLIVKNKVEYAEGEFFHETFDAFEGTGGRDNRFKGEPNESNFAGAKFDLALTDEVWAFASDAKIYGANKSARLGNSSTNGVITTRIIELTGDGTLTFSAAGWGDGSNKLTVSAEGATLTSESGKAEITLSNGEWVAYTYAISDAQGEITLTFSGKRAFIDDIIVTNEKTTFPEEATIAFDLENDQINVNYVEGEDFEEPTLINEMEVEPIYYSSSKEEVATVDEETGEVTLTGVEGTAVITATFNGNDNYSPATASYTIIVTVPTQPTDDVFELAEQITEGDEIIIVGEHKIAANEEAGTEESIDYYGLSTNQKDNNRGAVTVTYNSDGTIQGNSKLQVITIEGNAEGWYFNVGNGYLYAASSSANWLRTETEADDNAKATITIGEDQADIIFQGTNTHNVLKFNFNNGSPLFSCYTSSSSQLPVKIYRKKAALLGDANNDGIVNVTDVMLVVRYSGGGEVLYINLKNADINKDGQVNITDAMAILPLAI